MGSPINRFPQGSGPNYPMQSVVQRTPSAGVGSAPSTISALSASSNPTEKGCIEHTVCTMRDWIVWIFRKISCCWTDQPTISAPTVAPTVASNQQLVNYLNNTKRGEDVIRAFNEQFLPMEKEHIFTQIGQDSNSYAFWKGYSQIGRERSIINPDLLKQSLIHRLNSNINSN